MKFIIAIIKPFKLDEVRDALGAIGVSTNMLPKVKIEIAASDELTPQIVETIQQVASTEAIGDGKVFVLDLASATRIRTGETGDTAL